MNAMGGYLAFVMALGAARNVATPEQMAKMRYELLPAMRDPEVPMYAVVLFLWEIMGDAWTPEGDWATWIESLVGDTQ